MKRATEIFTYIKCLLKVCQLLSWAESKLHNRPNELLTLTQDNVDENLRTLLSDEIDEQRFQAALQYIASACYFIL